MLEVTFDDSEVERIAIATAKKVDRATDLLVDLIMAIRDGDKVAYATAKAEAEQLLGLGAYDA